MEVKQEKNINKKYFMQKANIKMKKLGKRILHPDEKRRGRKQERFIIYEFLKYVLVKNTIGISGTRTNTEEISMDSSSIVVNIVKLST